MCVCVCIYIRPLEGCTSAPQTLKCQFKYPTNFPAVLSSCLCEMRSCLYETAFLHLGVKMESYS